MPSALGSGLLAAVLALGGVAVTTPAQHLPHAPTPSTGPDQLAIVSVGDGETYGNVAGPVRIDIIDATGAALDSVALPTTPDGDQHRLTLGVDRDQAGALQQSEDRAYVTVGGYDAELGADTNGSLAPETLRVVGRIGAEGDVDTSTTLDGAYNERHVRGVASVDGQRYWTGGHGNDSEDPYWAGMFTIENGGDTPEVVVTDAGTGVSNQQNNTRVPVIHEGQLYVSSDRSGYHGVNRVGEDIPTEQADLTLVAPAPAGREVPHDFAFIGDHLYVTYTEGEPALVRYEEQGGEWTVNGAFPGEFWGVTGRPAGDDTVLYAVRGSDAGNEIVALVDGGELADASLSTIAVAAPNTAYRGVAFAPGFTPGDGPVEEIFGPQTSWDVRVPGGAGNALSAVLGADTNPVATGSMTDPEGEAFTVEVSSGDQDVVADEDISFELAGDGSFVLAAEPTGTGTTVLSLTATTQDGRTGTAQISYWVSAPIEEPSALAHVGMADASAAYDVGEGHLLVADDDSNQIRLYGPTFDEPVTWFDFSAEMEHPTDRAFDLEGAARADDTIYWVGSLGNSRSGNYWPHRDIVLATEVSGSGADTELSFVGEATGFRDALVEWDNSDGHGEGAGAFQFERALSDGWSAEGPNSLNVEGATIAPDGSTLWLGFRSPLLPVADEPGIDPDGDTALIVGIENIADVVAGGEIVVGEHILLDLDGRAIRDLTETEDGGYLIAAGSADDTGNFAVYGWSGDPADEPVISTTPLTLEGWEGSYEAFGAVPSLATGTTIRVMQDVGTLDLYGTGTEAQDLTREHMKFVSHDYVLDFADEEPGDSPVVHRVEGSNRYGTAAELALDRFEPGLDTVFVASGQDFPDAIAGGALAVAEQGPVLLTRPDALATSTLNALTELAPQRVVVLGGEAAVEPAVLEELGALAPVVDRVAGLDRYRTAAAIAQEWDSSDVVFLASGQDHPDALSAAAAAGVEGAPVLLTRGHSLPGATASELERLNPSVIYVIGGEGAISAEVLAHAGEYADVVRLAGLDRYRTASVVAQEFFTTPVAEAFLATGRDYPDALAAAPVAALSGGPVLLTRPDSVPAATMTALDALRAEAITLLGGYEAISQEVEEYLAAHVYP